MKFNFKNAKKIRRKIQNFDFKFVISDPKKRRLSSSIPINQSFCILVRRIWSTMYLMGYTFFNSENKHLL